MNPRTQSYMRNSAVEVADDYFRELIQAEAEITTAEILRHQARGAFRRLVALARVKRAHRNARRTAGHLVAVLAVLETLGLDGYAASLAGRIVDEALRAKQAARLRAETCRR